MIAMIYRLVRIHDEAISSHNGGYILGLGLHCHVSFPTLCISLSPSATLPEVD